jgi:hypothetical protein
MARVCSPEARDALELLLADEKVVSKAFTDDVSIQVID